MILNTILFSNFLYIITGFYGIIKNYQNLILVMISLEVIFLGINLTFILNAFFMNDLFGEIISLLVLTVIGAETAIGLTLAIASYRVLGHINIYEQLVVRN